MVSMKCTGGAAVRVSGLAFWGGRGWAGALPPTLEAARAEMGLGRGSRGSWRGAAASSLLLVDKRGSVWPEDALVGRIRPFK